MTHRKALVSFKRLCKSLLDPIKRLQSPVDPFGVGITEQAVSRAEELQGELDHYQAQSEVTLASAEVRSVAIRARQCRKWSRGRVSGSTLSVLVLHTWLFEEDTRAGH